MHRLTRTVCALAALAVWLSAARVTGGRLEVLVVLGGTVGVGALELDLLYPVLFPEVAEP